MRDSMENSTWCVIVTPPFATLFWNNFSERSAELYLFVSILETWLFILKICLFLFSWAAT